MYCFIIYYYYISHKQSLTISILYYDMIYVSETIDVNNKTAFKESII